MRFKRKVVYSSLVASGTLIASMLYPIVPCKIMPNVPNPSSSFSPCTLNPAMTDQLNALTYYFGSTTDLITAYFMVLLISFGITFFVLHLTTLKHK